MVDLQFRSKAFELTVCPFYNKVLIAEHLSARLLIVQCNQFAFVCMYVYPSHFNCMGAVSVVLSPDY